MTGAVTYEQCPNGGGNKCRCGNCKVCGFPKHTAIHGPKHGQKAGSEPHGHEYQPHDSR